MKKAPKTIYVTIENEGDQDELLVVSDKIESIDIGPGEIERVFVYELKEVRKLKCTSVLV